MIRHSGHNKTRIINQTKTEENRWTWEKIGRKRKKKKKIDENRKK